MYSEMVGKVEGHANPYPMGPHVEPTRPVVKTVLMELAHPLASPTVIVPVKDAKTVSSVVTRDIAVKLHWVVVMAQDVISVMIMLIVRIVVSVIMMVCV
jgi:hypothetical protein